MYHDITCTYITTMVAAEPKPDSELTKDTPYLTLIGKLWGLYHECFGEKWLL